NLITCNQFEVVQFFRQSAVLALIFRQQPRQPLHVRNGCVKATSLVVANGSWYAGDHKPNVCTDHKKGENEAGLCQSQPSVTKRTGLLRANSFVAQIESH